MDDDRVSREIEELERALVRDAIDEIDDDLDREDPDFVQRMHRLERAEIVNALAVFLLLAVGAVLMTVGLATLSWPAWAAGGLAFVVSFAVDHHHRRMVG
jgi:hypothetical protein